MNGWAIMAEELFPPPDLFYRKAGTIERKMNANKEKSLNGWTNGVKSYVLLNKNYLIRLNERKALDNWTNGYIRHPILVK